MNWFKNFWMMVLDLMADLEEEQVYTTPSIPLTQFEMVGELHKNAGHPVRLQPTIPDAKEQELLIKLIDEEFKELKDALAAGDLKEVVDALGDLAVVVNGAGHRCGVNMDKLASVIHDSNMSKFCDDMEEAIEGTLKYSDEGIKTSIVKNSEGRYVIYREDGKFLKGPKFSVPDIKAFIAEQGVFVE